MAPCGWASERERILSNMPGTLVQINVSAGGMPKISVPEAHVSRDGVAGDWQANRKYHGGADRAVCIFSRELYAWLADEHGIVLQAGSIGENFTTAGVDLQALRKGDRLRVGRCVIEITNVRVPCKNLLQWHPRLPKAIQDHSGWVAKVIEEAMVRPGDLIELLAS
jgi:MOSC domain-containing protein YiiM